MVGATDFGSEYIQPDTVMVTKYDVGGNLLWKDYTPRTPPRYSGNNQEIRAQLDSKGNLYILFSEGSNAGEVVKFNHGGERTVIADSSNCTYCLMHIDDNDNLYTFGGDVVKYSNDTMQWTSLFGTTRS